VALLSPACWKSLAEYKISEIPLGLYIYTARHETDRISNHGHWEVVLGGGAISLRGSDIRKVFIFLQQKFRFLKSKCIICHIIEKILRK
jgi:hypothetical protein